MKPYYFSIHTPIPMIIGNLGFYWNSFGQIGSDMGLGKHSTVQRAVPVPAAPRPRAQILKGADFRMV